MLKSKIALGNYLLLLFVTIIFGTIPILALLTSVIIERIEFDLKVAVSIIFLVVLIFPYWRFLITAFPRIELGKKNITLIRNRNVITYEFSDISSIQLNETMYSIRPYLRQSGIRINTNDGETIVIWNRNYRNIHKIREFLINNFDSKINGNRIEKFNEVKIGHANPTSLHFSFISQGFLVRITVMLAMLALFANFDNIMQFIIFVFVFMFVMTRFGYDLNYFILKSDHLILSNYIWFFKRNKINLKDISEIVVANGSLGKKITIVFQNQKTKEVTAHYLTKNGIEKLVNSFPDFIKTS